MYSTDRTQSPHGQCSVISVNGTLQVNFPRSLFGGKRKRLALGLKDTPENRVEAEKRIKAIQTDIDFGQFDLTLERYKPKHKQKAHLEKVQDIFPDTKLLDLWDKYVDYKRVSVKESTLYFYKASVTSYLEKCPIKSPYQSLELRQWLLENTTKDQTKKILTHLNAAFKWGLQHRVVKGSNPYDGMAKEWKYHYEENPEPNPFNQDEKAKILNAFLEHKGNWNGRGFTGAKYSYYYPFVKFLFSTGCRPSEAIGVRWGDISNDFGKISFNKNVYTTGSKIVQSQGSKNNKKRIFPCNEDLRGFLSSIKPDNAQPDDLVFPSPKGVFIRYGNFSNKAWNKMVDPIKPNTTPYCCRDTFISEQIAKGVNPAMVGKWCDTSTAMIEKHYLGDAGIAHIVPM